MSSAAEERYGAPQLTIHRADLLAVLANAFPVKYFTIETMVIYRDG